MLWTIKWYQSINVMSSDVGEAPQSFHPTLSAIATLTDSSWRVRGIWFHERVDEHHTAFYLVDDLFPSWSAVDRSSKPVLSWVCQLNSVLFILCFEESENWTKKLLIVHLGSRGFQNGKRVERLLNLLFLPCHFPTDWYFTQLILQILV